MAGRTLLPKPNDTSNLATLQFLATTRYCRTCMKEASEMIIMVPDNPPSSS